MSDRKDAQKLDVAFHMSNVGLNRSRLEKKEITSLIKDCRTAV